MSKTNPSIEDLLIPKDDSEAASEALSEKIKDIRLQNKEKEAQKKASSLGFSYINLHGLAIPPEALVVLPEEKAKEMRLVCFFNDFHKMRLAATQPDDPLITQTIKELENRHQAQAELYLASEKSMNFALSLYQRLPQIKNIKTGVSINETDLIRWQKEIKNFSALQTTITKASLTEVVTIIISSALQAEASDIHIEAEEKEVKIRYRIDGILHTVASLPSKNWQQVISRIKLLAKLKININTIPQDGRFTIHLKNDEVDVRVSTVPTAYGESVVMRLLRSSSVGLQFNDLGLTGEAWEKLKKEINKPNGMIVTTGPTGSGKTTTLYAVLTTLNNEETKIITLEDPIEYKLEGVNQSQIDYGKDYTFAKGLRSILRQDPDIIMVGEIRDQETADISVNAALTGHLVITTLHTNSAAGTIPRFLAMEVKPFLLAPALNVIIGQRLVRKLCQKCKKPQTEKPDLIKKAREVLAQLPDSHPDKKNINLDKIKFFTASTCDQCHGLGYKGRTGIYEVMIVGEEIEKLILSNQATEYNIQKVATKQGMITMVQDGVLKALQGITSLEEVFKKAE